MEHDVRLEVRHQAEDSFAVAHIGEAPLDLSPRLFGREHFQHSVQRGL